MKQPNSPFQGVSVYVAGPVTVPDPITNTRVALDYCEEIRNYGFNVFSPHLGLTWELLRPHDYEWRMQYGFDWLRKCDCVFRITGYSKGSDREEELAKHLGKPVFYTIAAMHAYYRRRRVYLICPVRNCTPEQKAAMDKYVDVLEQQGCEVHYPPRDVNQSNDDGGVRICVEHMKYMAQCNEVHVWYDNESKGSHFDLGMAFIAPTLSSRPLKVVWANNSGPVAEKSFQNVLAAMSAGKQNP